MEICPANVSDIEEIHAIEQENFSDSWTEAQLRELLKSSLDLLLVCKNQGAVYGYLNLRMLGEEAELMRIAVKRSMQNQGFGIRLMQSMLEICRENGIQEIFLEVRQSNSAAIALYTKFGFECYALRKEYYSHPAEDAQLMKKCMPDLAKA